MTDVTGSESGEVVGHPALAPIDQSVKDESSLEGDAQQPSDINIKSISLHQIDSSANEVRPITISGDFSDLNSYLKKLLEEIDGQEHKRSYVVNRDTTEFAVALREFSLLDELVALNASGLASKLLSAEVKADKEHGHLGKAKGKKGIVNRGSFLQFLYETSGRSCYLGLKIEHQVFFDENDFKRKSGLPESSKVYKACRVIYSGLDLEDISVYDKNAKPSVYWVDDFLEVSELRNDALNTVRAANAIIKVLNVKIKRGHPEEYTQIRNAAIVALKQKKQINYYDLVDELLAFAVFDDPKFNAKIPDIVSEMKKAPSDTKDGFDPQFISVPALVPYKRRRIELGREIVISYPEDMKDLNKSIWATKGNHGEKLVVIKSDDGFDFFQKSS
jgi:hypothetical protein